MSQDEEVMTGGNVNKVVRVGETIRREAKPNLYVYELLNHLEGAGFKRAPRFLGHDEMGREMLSFIEGEVPGNEYPEIKAYMWSEASLMELAKMLRQYHDATQGFTSTVGSENPFSDPEQNEVICHNDAALYNIVFQNGLPAALIDFDMAGPGPRMWDIAYTLYTSVPLTGFAPSYTMDKAVVSYDSKLHALERRRRVHLFFDSYGVEIPSDLKSWTMKRLETLCATLTDRAAAGEPAFVKMVEEGHLAHYEQEIDFLNCHFDEWI